MKHAKNYNNTMLVNALFSGIFSLSLALHSALSYAQNNTQFAALGRIEGAQPTAKLGFTIGGTVKEVLVQGNSKVAKGTLLATLVCDDRVAAVALAEAELTQARSLLDKTKNGAKLEERKLAIARVQAAEAEAQLYKNTLTRFELLKQKGGTITEAQVETASDQARLSQARVSVALAQGTLVSAPARTEDGATANAQVQAMLARLQSAKADAEKCNLRAPISGTLLKMFVERGDVVSVLPPKIAATLSDLTKLRVRAEVDERFVEKLKINQVVSISSDFNPKLRLSGKVLSREAEMGRRSILGIDPADKNDRDVMEVIIELDAASQASAAALAVGYRVSVLFGG